MRDILKPAPGRVRTKDIGVENILPFEEKHTSNEYYQVIVGNYGIVLPNTINLDTFEGLTLTKEKASVIKDKKLATRIALETGGKLLGIKEQFIREVKEIKEGEEE